MDITQLVVLSVRYQQAENEPTAQIAHLVFANTRANAGKIKRAIFYQRSPRIMR
jgi:hypothetical protein